MKEIKDRKKQEDCCLTLLVGSYVYNQKEFIRFNGKWFSLYIFTYLSSLFPEFGKFDNRQNLSNATSAKSMVALQSAKKSVARAKEKKIDNNHSNFTIAVFILNIPFYFISLAYPLFRLFHLVVQKIPTWNLWLTILPYKPSIVNIPHSGIKISLYLAFSCHGEVVNNNRILV